ncbi:RHD3/Sey1 [Kalaharituber pfeilii]|nr:RHD3/Sey1 [Kalaharituber pfeilii]
MYGTNGTLSPGVMSPMIMSPSGTLRRRPIGNTGSRAEKEEDYESGIQVIDETKEFTPNLSVFLSTQGLLTAGFNYHIVAVFGSQSTGKSTLLNHLFGTSFMVMDEKARKQTTKGIWMSRAEAEDGMMGNILVMDVEGTDGRERGEDQDFERKSALFALATSEVMIVNIWEHQVGLYQGANMGLLKTVFEVNLQLFQKNQTTSQRSLLFFVIRDHVGHTPIKSLAELLLADLSRIWSSLTKPPGLEESQISDFFDFEFAALPHKILQAEQFVEQTKLLRKRFREVEDEEQLASSKSSIHSGTGPLGGDSPVFLPSYHRRIPADGFPMYAEGIWSQIITNKDLDLPTQQELLAQYRCDEISNNCMTKFDQQIGPFEENSRSGKGVLAGLGPIMKKARKDCLAEFEESAGRYYKPVFKRKKEELISKIDARLKALVVLQLAELHKRAVTDFEEEVVSVLKTGKGGVPNGTANGSATTYDFRTIVDTARESAIKQFEEEAEELVLPPEENSSWAGYEKQELEALKKDMDVVAARLRVEEMKRLVGRLERTLRSKLGEGVGLEFSKMTMKGDDGVGDGSMLWDGIWKVFEREVTEGAKIFKRKAESFNAGENEIKVGIWRLKRRGWSVLKAKIEEEVGGGNLLMKLRENFEDRFRYDDSGVPRVWKPSDDIESHYRRAREATIKLIPLVSHIKLNSTGSEPPLSGFVGPVPADAHLGDEEGADQPFPAADEFSVLSEAKQVELTNRFKRTADALYVEAKRSTISSVAQIPVYFYALLLALGWNEIWAVLRNPLYFMFMLVLAALGYIIYTLNLAGPMMRVGNAMFSQGLEIAREKLRDFVNAGESRGRRESAVEADNIGMVSLDKSGKKLKKREVVVETSEGEDEKEEW